jgi:hypothetical protein
MAPERRGRERERAEASIEPRVSGGVGFTSRQTARVVRKFARPLLVILHHPLR